MKKSMVFQLLLGMLFLLAFAGCAAQPPIRPESAGEQESVPLEQPVIDDQETNAGMVERMSDMTAEDIQYISAFDQVTAQQVAQGLRSAAGQKTYEPENFYSFYHMTVYLSEIDSSDEEQFTLSAGLEEDLVEVVYRNGKGDSESGWFSDDTLYWLLRNTYCTEGKIETEQYNMYQEIIEARALEDVQTVSKPDGTPAFTGYEITGFAQKDTLEANSGTYEVCTWSVAFLIDTSEIMEIPWAGGMYLDAEGRVCGYEQETYFVVNTAATEEYRFLPWDLHSGPDEAAGKENALHIIETAFADNERLSGKEQSLLGQ